MRFFFLIILMFSISAEAAKKIALTFDDSPRSATGYLDGPTRAKKLIESLKAQNVEGVTFFSISKNIDSEGDQRLKTYAKAGHIIANHTHSHPNFNDTSGDKYVDDFLRADRALSSYSSFRKWFRFPFLREGNTEKKRNKMRVALASHGYTNAYITSNNYDWHIESLFQKYIAKNPSLDLAKVKKFYVETLMESIEYYDKMAIKHLGRSPKHILLLHEMDITALFIGDLIVALRAKGWEIIGLEEALHDEIASYKTSTVFPYNPGRIGEIARDKGQKKGLWHISCNEGYLDQKFTEAVLGPQRAPKK